MLFVAKPITSSIVFSVLEDSVQREVARGLFSVSFYCLGFVISPPKLEIFPKFRFN